MKKILLLMVLTGSMAMAGEACLKGDFDKIVKDVFRARELREGGVTAKLKFTRQVTLITAAVAHILTTHLNIMTPEQTNEVNDIKTEFSS